MTRLRNSTLAREISLALVIKVILMFGLWLAFFSEPIDRDLTDNAVSKVILGASWGAPRGAP